MVVTRYYISSVEYKWTHAETDIEHFWIRRKLGEELYKTVESNNWKWVLLRSNSQTLPDDIFCRCDIYVDLPQSKQATLFVIKYSKLKLVEVL